MRKAHRKISEMLRYGGIMVADEENGFAEIVMDGLDLGEMDMATFTRLYPKEARKLSKRSKLSALAGGEEIAEGKGTK